MYPHELSTGPASVSVIDELVINNWHTDAIKKAAVAVVLKRRRAAFNRQQQQPPDGHMAQQTGNNY